MLLGCPGIAIHAAMINVNIVLQARHCCFAGDSQVPEVYRTSYQEASISEACKGDCTGMSHHTHHSMMGWRSSCTVLFTNLALLSHIGYETSSLFLLCAGFQD